jgi:2-amino-4-hydroxy-6-hydroxymethyldihydropteridine diphosphokinase/dihydropteroate synthase
MGRMVEGLGDWPVVIGTSRKGFIGRVTGEEMPRLMGTAATVAHAAANGAGVVRVHDVKEMVAVVRMVRAMAEGPGEDGAR